MFRRCHENCVAYRGFVIVFIVHIKQNGIQGQTSTDLRTSNILNFFTALMFMQSAAPHFKHSLVFCLQISSEWLNYVMYWSRCWNFCGWIDIRVLPHHYCYILITSWRSCETIFGDFLLMKITHTHCITTILIDYLSDLVYKQASHIWGNKMPLCRQLCPLHCFLLSVWL
jgi:hypothetical protein